jgi:hypothetical protein
MKEEFTYLPMKEEYSEQRRLLQIQALHSSRKQKSEHEEEMCYHHSMSLH